MKRTIYAIIAGCSLVAGAAWAQQGQGQGTSGKHGQQSGQMGQGQDDKSGQSGQTGQTGQAGSQFGSKSGQSDEPKKHLSEIDVYLTDALNNCKVLYQSTQMQPGHLDQTLQREGAQNIDRAIGGAMTHLGHIKSLSDARVEDTNNLTQLSSQLAQSKAVSSQLKSAVKSDNKSRLQILSSQLCTNLRGAVDTFGQLAQKQNLTRVENIDVPERQPVSGQGQDDESKKQQQQQQQDKPPSGSQDFDQPPPSGGQQMQQPPSGGSIDSPPSPASPMSPPSGTAPGSTYPSGSGSGSSGDIDR